MDTLAAYGSDSDDTSTASSSAGPSHQKVTPKIVKGLESDVAKTKKIARNSSPLSHSADDQVCKKPRYGNNPKNESNDFLSLYHLPKPSLEGDTILSCWSMDYVSSSVTTNDNESSNPKGEIIGSSQPPRPYTKFHALSKSLSSLQKNWSSQLREQKEFYNPHFFQSMVEYFDISDPLGSHVDRMSDATNDNRSSTTKEEE